MPPRGGGRVAEALLGVVGADEVGGRGPEFRGAGCWITGAGCARVADSGGGGRVTAGGGFRAAIVPFLEACAPADGAVSARDSAPRRPSVPRRAFAPGRASVSCLGSVQPAAWDRRFAVVYRAWRTPRGSPAAGPPAGPRTPCVHMMPLRHPSGGRSVVYVTGKPAPGRTRPSTSRGISAGRTSDVGPRPCARSDPTPWRARRALQGREISSARPLARPEPRGLRRRPRPGWIRAAGRRVRAVPAPRRGDGPARVRPRRAAAPRRMRSGGAARSPGRR